MKMDHDRTASRNVLVASTVATEACLRGVARFARRHGWHLVSDMALTGSFPCGWKGDGIIAVMAYQNDMVSDILAAEAPCVEITLGGEGMFFPSIRTDHTALGRLAADHLCAGTYRSFVWAPFVGDQMNRECHAGFAARLAEHGRSSCVLPPAHRLIGGRWLDDWTGHRHSMLAELEHLPLPAAVFAANDCVASEILEACRELGLAAPTQVAVLGVGNDVNLCESASIPLSSVELDLEELAFRAAATLHGIMEGRSVPDIIRVPPGRVVPRLSTAMCLASDVPQTLRPPAVRPQPRPGTWRAHPSGRTPPISKK